MPYIFGKLWHLAIIWAIRKAFQCILQGVRFLLANHTRISPTSDNDWIAAALEKSKKHKNAAHNLLQWSQRLRLLPAPAVPTAVPALAPPIAAEPSCAWGRGEITGLWNLIHWPWINPSCMKGMNEAPSADPAESRGPAPPARGHQSRVSRIEDLKSERQKYRVC